ncbi:MAG: glycerophosphodiester phosphodiesterase family protein [Ferruginibacter sp.]
MSNKCSILAIILSAYLFACNTSKVPDTENSKYDKPIIANFDYQGHRGCRGLMPENTIPAMLKAIDLGVITLEMDVVFTKDNVAILSHEPFFNHEITTKADGIFVEESEEKKYNIYKMTFAETQKYDVGLKQHPRFEKQQKTAAYKPSLAGMIDSVEAYTAKNNLAKISYNIETKTLPATDKVYHPAPAAFVGMLMKVIIFKKIEDRVTIQSFDRRTLQYLHKKYPTLKTALLVEASDKNSFRKQLKDLGFSPTVYSPEESLVNPNLITECHKRNIQIIPWTVNDKKDISKLKKMGVDGIISDYPDLFK